MTIGDNIKRLREQKGLSQQDLAELMNVTHGAVSLWESDKRSMNVKQADKLAAALGVTLNELVKE
jgi:transcriptional regulator with XRE-family HTH domain